MLSLAGLGSFAHALMQSSPLHNCTLMAQSPSLTRWTMAAHPTWLMMTVDTRAYQNISECSFLVLLASLHNSVPYRCRSAVSTLRIPFPFAFFTLKATLQTLLPLICHQSHSLCSSKPSNSDALG